MTSFELPDSSGIYRIRNTINGKFYLGSSINLRDRWKQHRLELQRNDHGNRKLQHAWNKYGPDAFRFETIEIVLAPFRLEREQYWLDKLKPFGKKGYNIALRTQGRVEREISEATRQKLRESSTGRKHRPEAIEKCRLANLGHEVSPQTRAKISAAAIGKKRDPTIYDARRKTLIVTSPDGVEQLVTGIRAFCTEHQLDISSLMRVAKGESSQHKGWKARYPGDDLERFTPCEVSSDERSTRASSQKKTLIVIDPDGVTYTVHGVSQFARHHGLDRNHLIDVAEGRRHHHKGWKASYPQD